MDIVKAYEILDKEVTSYAMSSDGIKYNSYQMLKALEVVREYIKDKNDIINKCKELGYLQTKDGYFVYQENKATPFKPKS